MGLVETSAWVVSAYVLVKLLLAKRKRRSQARGGRLYRGKRGRAPSPYPGRGRIRRRGERTTGSGVVDAGGKF